MPPDRRADHDRGVGDPAGHHDVGARLEGARDAERTEIGVRRQGTVEAELGGPRREVVAVDPGDLRREPLLLGDLAQLLDQTGRVEPAGVGDDPDALLQRQGQAVGDLGDEGARVAERGILELVLAQDQHGQLGEVVTGDDVDLRRPRAARAWPRGGRRRNRCSCRRGGPGLETLAGARPQPPVGPRPSPGGPAKAWAMSSQRSASGPVATRSRSSRWRRWVTRRQKSYADPRTDCAASAGPHSHSSPDGRAQLDPELLGRRLERVHAVGVVAGAHTQVGDVPDPVGRLGRGAERLGHVERVRPGLHEARGGHRRRAHRRPEPRHLLAGGVAPQRRLKTRPAQHATGPGSRPRSPSLLRAPRRRRTPPGRRWPSGRPASQATLSVAAKTATSSVHARCTTWVAMSQPAAGVGVRQPDSSSGATIESSASPSRARSASTWSRRSVIAASAPCRGCAPRQRGSGCRRAVSSVIVLASPRPRTRSRVACTSSRTRGWLSSTSEGFDGDPVGLATDPLLEAYDGGVQRLVGPRGDPQLQRRGEHRAGEVVGEHLEHGPRTPLAGRQRGGRLTQLLAASLGQVLDGRDHEVVLRREVVQLGTAADPGALGDQRGRGAAPAVLDQALDGGLEQALPHRAGAFLLRHTRRGDLGAGHACIVARQQQTVKTDFIFWWLRSERQAL